MKVSEHSEQCALFKIALTNPICRRYLWASANGGSRHILEARNLKRAGVKKGVPDIQLAYPSKGYHGLFIELKRRYPIHGVITPEQREVLDDLNKVGYLAEVAYGWEEAWQIITNYLGD